MPVPLIVSPMSKPVNALAASASVVNASASPVSAASAQSPRLLTAESLHGLLPARPEDSHKGDYGHLLIIAGCQRMPGAAVLATGAALHSGCGLVTLHSSSRALQATVNNYPSAMLDEENGDVFSHLPENLGKYTAVVVGPGLGQAPETAKALGDLLDALRQADAALHQADCPARAPQKTALLLDADALNLLARDRFLLEKLPEGTVLTPHKGELKRLLQKENPTGADITAFCRKTGGILVAKGHRTGIFSSDGLLAVNTSGNAGLAKGGSGDVLSGLIGGLLARGLKAEDAASLGVWIHGHAADELSRARTLEAWDSKELIDGIWTGFRAL